MTVTTRSTACSKASVVARTASHVERNSGLYIAAFLYFYWFVTILHSMRRMWHDELFTFYMARLPGTAAIWSALKAGVDLNPPLIYMATRACHRLFGVSEVSTRLPAIAGFCLMCCCLLWFVSRRCGRLYGMVAMSFPVLTSAYFYASEARAYGMVLGFVGVALVSWQLACDGQCRRASVPVFAIALCGALLTHCYAALVLIPFGLGEVARLYRNRRIDYPVWGALFSSLLCFGFYIPLFGGLRSITWSRAFLPSWSAFLETYAFLLGPALWVVVIALAIAAGTSRQRENLVITDPQLPGLRSHELICLAAFAAIPIVAVIVGIIAKAVLFSRYAIVAILGVSSLLTSFLWKSTRSSTIAAAWIYLLFLGWFVGTSTIWVAGYGSRNPFFKELPALDLNKLPSNMPIVLSNGLMYLEADHYYSEPLLSRLYYLTDRKIALAYTGSDVFDESFKRAKQWFPLRSNLADYSEFKAKTSHFLVFGPYAYANDWLLNKLADDGASFVLKGHYASPHGDCVLLEVNLPDGGISKKRG